MKKVFAFIKTNMVKLRKGFTLIELLAVIIILAVVAIIATPKIIDVVKDAKTSSITSSLAGYADALKLKVTTDYFSNDETYSSSIIADQVEASNDSVNCEELYYKVDNQVLMGNCSVNNEGTFWYVNGEVTESKPTNYDSLASNYIATNVAQNPATAEACFFFDPSTGTITGYDTETRPGFGDGNSLFFQKMLSYQVRLVGKLYKVSDIKLF